MAPASPLHAVDDLPGFLAGTWSVARTVEDHRGARHGDYAGRAWFVVADGGVDWAERGTLRLDGHAGEATRTLRIVPGPDGWEVRFDHGGFFHPLDLAHGRSVVDHPCAADHYVGEIRVEARDRLVIAWRVSGPTKDQTIVSVYRRTDAEPEPATA